MTTQALLVLAAEAAESSKAAFYALGGALAVWAVVLAAIGLRQPEFPATARAARGVYGISLVMVALAAGSAIVTAL